VAVDIPSGLCSDSGCVRGVAVHAAHTVTFIGRKRGLYTAAARDHCGELHFDALGVPGEVHETVPAGAELLSLGALLAALPPRARTAHKGHFGHVLVIGGGRGMAGAAAMAAESAARCGAGLVSLATWPGNVAATVARRPEVMAHGVAHGHELEPLLARASVLVIGPGLGRGPWAQQLLVRALATGKPAVLDADALNAIADGEVPAELPRAQCVVTPHPGEAARLLGTTTPGIEADRFAALQRLRALFPGAVVLKGAGTLVASGAAGGRTGVCPYGNPGMASGGMGDVLSGVLGALLAQGLVPGDAARLGVCLHARAADLAAAAEGERGLLATDLVPWLRRLLNAGAPAEAGV
jgi:NAD(P)H-hydrate epimerase